MRSKLFSAFLFFFLISNIAIHAQNYLRVSDPDGWEAVNSHLPDWHQYADHAGLDEVTLIMEPQGIYTEIGFYATISEGQGWGNELEIIWQFELPSNTIVHDSWLWVGPDIIKADIVDYWTALETYEGIVDRNEDPSFFYQLPDNRYEIRIYPLFPNEERRIKMSFLVPTEWDAGKVATDILSNLVKSTDLYPGQINVGMPFQAIWQSPRINMDETMLPLADTVIGGTGNNLHYIEIDGDDFMAAENISFEVDAPLSADRTFLSTYEEGGEQYYQMVFAPEWEAELQLQFAKKSLILFDYDPAKSSMEMADIIQLLKNVFTEHYTIYDEINVAITSGDNVHFLSLDWWAFDETQFENEITNLLNIQDGTDLEVLLTEGFNWVQNHPEITNLYLLSASEEYAYPPVADDVFMNLENMIPTAVPFSILDFQDENISIIYFGADEYRGNEYFHGLLTQAFDETEHIVFHEMAQSPSEFLSQVFISAELPEGVLDYVTTLEDGACFQRYSVSETIISGDHNGVMMQTGKYLGDFPMHVNASFISDAGDVWTISEEIPVAEIIPGDTLMREIWYGQYLKESEAQSSSMDDILNVVQSSIEERVLTGFTAFLALEPSQGGEPCIDCLFNDGIIISTTEEGFDVLATDVLVTPNPASEYAMVQLNNSENYDPQEWSASIFDVSGKRLADLAEPVFVDRKLTWRWDIPVELKSGLYFFQINNQHGSVVGKIEVVK